MGWLDQITSKIAQELEADGLDDNDRSQLELASAFVDRNDFEEAANRLAPLLAKHPRTAKVLLVAGSLATARGETETAVGLFGRAVDNAPGFAEAWLGLAQTLFQLQRHEPALDAARKALATCERETTEIRERIRAQASLVQGRVALAQSRFQDALASFNIARAHGVPDIDVAQELGSTLIHSNPAESAKWYLLAASSPKATVSVVLQAARLQTSAEAANVLLRSALARTQTPPINPLPLRARLARGLAADHQVEEAAEQLRYFNPTQVENLDAQTCVDLAETFAVLERYEQASAWSARAEEFGQVLGTDRQLSWALGTGDLTTVQAFATRIETREPAVSSLVRAALGSPADLGSLEQLLAKSPPSAINFWASYAAPRVSQDENAGTLLQSFIEIVRPLGTAHELLWDATRARANLDRPFIVALLGEFNAGKSSLVNCLVGANLAPVGVKPTTATLNTFRHGMGGVHVLYRSSSGRKTRQLSPTQLQPFLSTLSDEDAAQIDTVEIFLPEPHLQRFEWVDTPGLNAPRDAHELLTKRFMSSADLVIWVLAAQQAAKASEVAVLSELFAAHTPVLALLNKIDQVEANDVQAIRELLESALGKSVFAILNSSLKDVSSAQTCRTQVLEVLEHFSEHRTDELKQRSALASLRPLIDAALTNAAENAPKDASSALDSTTWDPAIGFIERYSDELRESYSEGLRRAAQNLREAFVSLSIRAPEEDVLNLVVAALQEVHQVTLKRMQSLPVELRNMWSAMGNRYISQTRGRLEGGLAELLVSNSGNREAQRRYLDQALPDPARFLWQPWQDEALILAERKRDALGQERAKLVASQAIHNARFTQPLAALAKRTQLAWDTIVVRLTVKDTCL